MMPDLAWFVVGAGAGALIAWLVFRVRAVRVEAELAAERRKAEGDRKLLEEAGARFREAFQALAAEALRQNNQAFLDLARAALGEFQQAAVGQLQVREQAVAQLVRPVAEALGAVQQQIQSVEKERVGAYAALLEQVAGLKRTQEQLERETGQLVQALRVPAVRGRWGEIQLRRVVELAGMLEHCDFVEQETIEGPEGRLRPDLVVKLPAGKIVVVDAKAPLSAYLEAVQAARELEREEAYATHARQVRAHLDRLSSKAYWEQFEATPEFVVMFLPGENFFSAALQYDPGLIEYGVAQRVILATPTTLIALLRAVAYGWRQEKLAEHARVIAELGRELYERLGVWVEHLGRVGRNLDEAVEAYNRAVGSLEARVLVSARRFTELGVTVQGELGEVALVDRQARELRDGR
jgi:DNA recombination protein RmuC